MPRGMRKNYNEKISEIECELQKAKEKVASLEKQREELIQKRNDIEMKDFASFLQDMGLSIVEAKARLTAE